MPCSACQQKQNTQQSVPANSNKSAAYSTPRSESRNDDFMTNYPLRKPRGEMTNPSMAVLRGSADRNIDIPTSNASSSMINNVSTDSAASKTNNVFNDAATSTLTNMSNDAASSKMSIEYLSGKRSNESLVDGRRSRAPNSSSGSEISGGGGIGVSSSSSGGVGGGGKGSGASDKSGDGDDGNFNSSFSPSQFAGLDAMSGDAEKAMMGFITQLTERNFDSMIKSNVAFVKFFVPWCGHCARLAPLWESLAEKADSANVKIAEVDCSKQGKLCDAQGLNGYPSMVLYKGGRKVEEYSGKRTVNDMLEYVKKHSN